ncbi:hypothetical protein KSF_004540 [Reticulibacter mediterranei]|uniref:MmyB-like transcription regulator ligand binding domain-containing protein n=1 Tax=Reticulibacter mediterranei TaxID=2778369 RepID=A0A8J3IHL3_9CHLR|nr:hypothetical protein [Reticulibacter mediterranei]GHO90406.1 hypothetical protein KSF_004540 [Reticulibacter mediterranei]
MIDNESGPLDPSDELRDLLSKIEALRTMRQQQVKEHSHPHLKRFTQQELNDEACPTYKNLLIGRSQRVPGRKTILQIAQYLECSAAERNDLLLVARYLPESLELEGFQLKEALEQAQSLMGTLPYPALLLTHTFEVQAINALFLQFFEFPQLRFIPRHQRNLLHFFFHPNLPLRARSTFNEQEVLSWQAHASQCIQHFKQSNRLYQFEAWYQDLVEQLSTVADFRTYWDQDARLLDEADTLFKGVLCRHSRTGELLPIRFRRVHISLSDHRYPSIVAFLPQDDMGCAALASRFP